MFTITCLKLTYIFFFKNNFNLLIFFQNFGNLGILVNLKWTKKWVWTSGKKWATITHVRELKLWGKCEPIMSHAREWTSERGVHVCRALSIILQDLFLLTMGTLPRSKIKSRKSRNIEVRRVLITYMFHFFSIRLVYICSSGIVLQWIFFLQAVTRPYLFF